jgi:hypothetical protein
VSDLWLAYSHYVEASDNPANRPALWDAFVGRWKPEKVSRDCEFAGANLASELRRLRERLGFLPQSPAASATATAVAQASVGNVVIHNHIVIPGATAAERESKPPGEPAQAEGKIPAKSGKRAKPGRKRLEHFTLEYIRMTETSYERRRRRLLAGLP